jgi:hypothetical protein
MYYYKDSTLAGLSSTVKSIKQKIIYDLYEYIIASFKFTKKYVPQFQLYFNKPSKYIILNYNKN